MAAQEGNTQLDQAGPISIGAMRDGTNDCARFFPHLSQYFGNTILSRNRKILFAAGLAGSIKNSQSARVGGCCD